MLAFVLFLMENAMLSFCLSEQQFLVCYYINLNNSVIFFNSFIYKNTRQIFLNKKGEVSRWIFAGLISH